MTIKTRLGPCPTCGTARKVPHVAGADLRRAREDAGFSLRGFAKHAGYSAAYLSDVELGRRRATPPVVAAYQALEGSR